MTISTAATPLSYAGNDSTTAFPITWAYKAKAHVVATLRDSSGTETVQVLTTNYTLTDPGETGTLTMIVAPATGETLVITLEPPNTQETNFPLGGNFPANSVEDAVDLAAQRSQKIESLFDRAFRVPKTDTRSGSQLETPNETDRASKFLAFDASGDPIASSGPTGDSSIPVSNFIEGFLDDADAPTARATLGAASLTPISGQVKNLGMSFAVAASALTMTITTADGSVPSSTDPIEVAIRNATLATGTHSILNVTATQTLTISSGSTMGHTSNVAGTLHWYLINNAGTLELAVSTLFHGKAGIISTTAEGGAGGADSATVMYSATARTNVAFIWIGETVDTQTVAGTWAAVPTSATMVKEAEPASTDGSGVVELATDAEVNAASPSSSLVPSVESLRNSLITENTMVDASSGSPTEIDFTSIPSWVKEISIIFDQVSVSGTSNILIQLGDSGGFETTGYDAASSILSTTVSTNAYTTGFGVGSGAAANELSGILKLERMDESTNLWVITGVVGTTASTDATYTVVGRKALSAALDRVRITTVNGTDTYDNGNLNTLYK